MRSHREHQSIAAAQGGGAVCAAQREIDARRDWLDLSLSDARRYLIGDAAARYLLLNGRLVEHSAQPMATGDVLQSGLAATATPGRVTARSMARAWGEEAFRMGMLFAAPPRQTMVFSAQYVISASRWLRRFHDEVHTLYACEQSDAPGHPALDDCLARLRRRVHLALAGISADYARLRVDRALAGIMSMTNDARKFAGRTPAGTAIRREASKFAVVALMPVTPQAGHSLWQYISGDMVAPPHWPAVSPEALVSNQVTLVVEVDGRVRGRLQVHRGLMEADAQRLAVSVDNVRRHIAGRALRNIVYVPDRLINLVVS